MIIFDNKEDTPQKRVKAIFESMDLVRKYYNHFKSQFNSSLGSHLKSFTEIITFTKLPYCYSKKASIS